MSPDGATVFVTGSSLGGATFDDYATAAYDAATGAELWVSRYNGPGNSFDVASALGVSPDSSMVFVTGYSYGEASGYDYATVAYDAATGAQLWVSRYNGPANGDDFARALGVSPDGSTVFATGSSWGGATFDDYATAAYDAATGAQLWVSRYNGPGNGSDSANALGVSPDGSTVFVTGYGSNRAFSQIDYATVAYDSATGAELWDSRYDAPGNGFAIALGIRPDGSMVFVSGYSYDAAGTQSNYATVAYDSATGAELWVSTYNGPGNRSDDAYDMGVTPDGSMVFVTGQSAGAGAVNYATVAYDSATGAELWVSTYNGAANGVDSPNALGVSPDSSMVFVTGYSFNAAGTQSAYATVAYDSATGEELWAFRAGGKGYDSANALGVSPDGSIVVVTGSVQVKADGRTDYATIAYLT